MVPVSGHTNHGDGSRIVTPVQRKKAANAGEVDIIDTLSRWQRLPAGLRSVKSVASYTSHQLCQEQIIG